MTSQEPAGAIDFEKLYAAFSERYRVKRSQTATESDVATVVEELDEEAVKSAIQGLLTQMPDAAKMPPLELSQLLAEALAQGIERPAG